MQIKFPIQCLYKVTPNILPEYIKKNKKENSYFNRKNKYNGFSSRKTH